MKTPRNNPGQQFIIALAAGGKACDYPVMKPAFSLAPAVCAGLLLVAFAASAQTSRTNGPAPQTTGKQSASKQAPAPPAVSPAQSFDAFKNIPDRNIFNTRRYAGRTEAPPQTVRRDPVIESFSLLGTLDYPKGSVAFFEGSRESHRKAVKVDESIGDCKVTGIEPNLVRLEAAGKPVELKVGYMLRREDQGEWKMREAERASDYGSSYTSSSSSGFGSQFGSSGGSSFGNSSFNSRGGSSNSSRGGDSRGGSSQFSSQFNSRGGSSTSNSRGGSSNSGSSFGGSNPAETAQQRIREQDRNRDGKISRDEADSRLRPNFDLIDRNRDGSVDAEEYMAYYVSRSGGGSSSSGSSFNQGGSFNNSGGPGSSFGGGSSGFNSGNNNSSSSSAPSSGSTSSDGGGESDLLKRLMEQRSRENR